MIKHNQHKTSHTKPFGFTIVELVIVMVVIGVLVSMAAVAYTTTQKQSRDTKRNADMTVMQNELEKFYDKHGEYPPGCSNTNCTSWFHTTNLSTSIQINTVVTVDTVKTALPGIPTDFGDPRYSGEPPMGLTSSSVKKYFYYGGTVNYNTFSSSLSYNTPAPICTITSGLAPGQVGSYVFGYFSEQKNQWVLSGGLNGKQMTITGAASDGCVINKP